MDQERPAVMGRPRSILDILVAVDDEPCPRLTDGQRSRALKREGGSNSQGLNGIGPQTDFPKGAMGQGDLIACPVMRLPASGLLIIAGDAPVPSKSRIGP